MKHSVVKMKRSIEHACLWCNACSVDLFICTEEGFIANLSLKAHPKDSFHILISNLGVLIVLNFETSNFFTVLIIREIYV